MCLFHLYPLKMYLLLPFSDTRNNTVPHNVGLKVSPAVLSVMDTGLLASVVSPATLMRYQSSTKLLQEEDYGWPQGGAR